MPAIENDDGEIEYEVVESENATEPRIDVDIRGVRVVVPEDGDTNPESFIQKKSDWVAKKKQEYERYREMSPSRRFVEGAQFPFLGKDYVVDIEEEESYVDREGRRLVLSEAQVQTSSVEESLRHLYRDKARSHLRQRRDHFAESMSVEEAAEYDIEIRNQRTRWASCSPNQTLSFNWRLMMAPEDIIDYVVVHELAHLHEDKHTDRFWRIVRKEVPDYKQRAEWLEKNSSRLIFTEEDI